MRITLPLVNPSIHDNRLSDDVAKDFETECQIKIFKDEEYWQMYEETHVFSLWLEYGNNNDKALMYDVDLNDLEMFANSLMKSIEMLRRDYSDVIKDKIRKNEKI